MTGQSSDVCFTVHIVKRAKFQQASALNYGRIVHSEWLFPPEKVYHQCTDGMTEGIELQQADRNAFCNYTKMLEYLSPMLRREFEIVFSLHTTC